MMIRVKATEIREGDVVRFGGAVERIRINKRVAVLLEGHRGPITYALGEYVQVTRKSER